VRSPHSVSAVSLSPAAPTSPLHSASVHVTDVSYLANPSPVRGWREESFGEHFLSPMRLRDLSGESDLSRVTFLQMSVDSQAGSLGNFGSSLPSLAELRCVESVVPCVRDLGTGLARLVVLWLPHCQLRDLDGLPSLSSLEVSLLGETAITGTPTAGALHLPQ
jgi:hypothetical protein